MDVEKIKEECPWLNDVDQRWTAIGRLVNTYGTHAEKIAWALCRGDAAEWKLGANKTVSEQKALRP